MRTQVIFCLFMGLFSSAIIAEPKVELLDKVVALVGDDVVLSSEVDRRVKSVLSQFEERQQSLPSLEQLNSQVIERLIIESLQLQVAKRIGVRVSDIELDKTIENISLENKMFVDRFRQNIEESGTPWAIFREDIRNEVMVSRARNASVSRRIKVSRKEVDDLVEQINKQGENQTQYHLGHILLALNEGASPEELNQAREKAQKIIDGLRAGADFAEYAITHSSGQNALNGGDLGWRKFSELPSLFVASVRSMKKGDVSEPLRSGSGLHIIYLKDSKGGFETQQVIQTHARHILIKPNEIMDEQAALDKILLLRQRIEKGEKFADLAIQFSDDKSSGALGGDLKWSDPGTFVPEFNKVMQALEINELSEPVKTQFGWHLIEVLERREKDQTEDNKRKKAYQILHNRKFEEEAQLWVRELKDQAYIKIIDDK